MKKIESFTVDHLKLTPGVYVSRRDKFGETDLTTFDLRFTSPNEEPAMGTGAIHALEHLGATWLRNNADWAERVVYFGPMGRRTGFYLILEGRLEPKDILHLVGGMLEYIMSYVGQIPGASAKECGNYLDMDLPMAKYHTRWYRDMLENISEQEMRYPD